MRALPRPLAKPEYAQCSPKEEAGAIVPVSRQLSWAPAGGVVPGLLALEV